jgi:Peptidase family M23
MRRALAAALAFTALGAPARGQAASRTVGSVTFRADLARAWPGGVIVAGVASRGRLGGVFAILHGQRVPLYPSPLGLRALVPVPLGTAPGADVLGFEVWGRRGRQRIPLDIAIAPADYAPRTVEIPEPQRALLRVPGLVPESRRLLELLRTESADASAALPFRPPLGRAPAASFGSPQTWVGGSPVESLMDGLFGDRHRGLDYEGAGGIPLAPGAGIVLYAGQRTLTGGTIVLDHGQGIVSLLAHLARIDVHQGDRIEVGTPLGLVGDTGVAYAPHLHWGVYMHGTPVDPRVLLELTE